MSVPGGPTRADLARFSRPNPATAVSGKYATVTPYPEAKTNEFPVVPFAPDRYDTIAEIKQNAGDDSNTVLGKKWMVPFTDADAEYILRKQSQAQNANYERWLWQQYDTNDPAQAWIFQQIAPEQFEKRKQLILYQQNLATRYALLRLYGVKTEDDLMLKYLVETNQVELPKGPVWDPKQWMQNQMGIDDTTSREDKDVIWSRRYTAGYFSPFKLFDETGLPKKANTAVADPLSYSNDPLAYMIFQGSAAHGGSSIVGKYGSNPGRPVGAYDPDRTGTGVI